MLSLAIDISIILLLLFLLYIGYYAGIIKSFFAVISGFFAIVLAENYPYQVGINYYFVFVAIAIIIFLIGIFVFKIVKFLYLSIFDELAGACFGFFLWFILSANVVIPSLDIYVNQIQSKNIVIPSLDVYVNQIQSKIEKTTSIISKLSKIILPVFGKYIPSFIDNKKIKNIQDYMLFERRNE